MASYSSEEVTLSKPAELVWEKLSNLENLRTLLENVPEGGLPADKREMLEKIKIEGDTITIPGGPLGATTLRMTEKTPPTLVRLDGEGTPVPMSVSIHIQPLTSESSKAHVEFSLEIPAMLKPMVSGPLKQMVNQFATVLKQFPMA